VNATTTLEARAVGHAGDGLVSRQVRTTVVHDSVVPTIDLQSSATVAAANSPVAISARVADGGSGVATVTGSGDGRAHGTTLTPVTPASAVMATATWDSLSVTAGVHTVSVRATDRAGNIATVSRS